MTSEILKFWSSNLVYDKTEIERVWRLNLLKRVAARILVDNLDPKVELKEFTPTIYTMLSFKLLHELV